ncbi:UrcA family protein [Parasphingopyxis sp.]|uniref:UrcA family protein n=1 Tax=Parasphingopyxis sp. TaxID=1920299 RepID=UPI002606EC24|nr:UrcA family protein [Parasphingopyxis sp.]
MKNITALLIPTALVFGAAVAQPAVAHAAPAGNSIAVSHADLNLANAADRNTLQRRINSAVREVCGTGYSFDPRSRNSARECQERTLESITIPMPGVVASAE